MTPAFSVACLCAEWCDTCVAYRPGFLALAARFPQAEFRWIDIEEEEGYEVENFPTILVKRGEEELFNGVLLPHHAHLARLLEELIGGKPG
jgi:thiol-disulfide isomerase/thioredoxin